MAEFASPEAICLLREENAHPASEPAAPAALVTTVAPRLDPFAAGALLP